jgi:hypothetical protein
MELAEGLTSAKIAAEGQYAGKNHVFCRPHGLAEGLTSAKISRQEIFANDYSTVTSRSATMLMILMSGLIAGPAVSL